MSEPLIAWILFLILWVVTVVFQVGTEHVIAFGVSYLLLLKAREAQR